MTVYAYDPLSQAVLKDGTDTGFTLSKDRGLSGSYHVLQGSDQGSAMLDDQGYGFASIRIALEAFAVFDGEGRPNDRLCR
jgi:hypothetical protein